MGTDLILAAEQLELVIDEAVFGRLLFAQRALLLELRTPESFDGVHGGAELLVGELELLLEIAKLALQVGVLVLQLAEEGLMTGGRLTCRARIWVLVEVEAALETAVASVAYRKELAVVVYATAVQRLVAHRHGVGRARRRTRPVVAGADRQRPPALLHQHGAGELVVAVVAVAVAAAARHAAESVAVVGRVVAGARLSQRLAAAADADTGEADG